MKKNLIIKILSLGIGLAAGIVLVAKVCFELSYDRNFKDADRIYKIMTGFTQSGQYEDFGQVSGAIAPGMMREVPGVEYGTRVTFLFGSDRYRFVDQGDDSFIKGELVLADTCFFKVFGHEVIAGDPAKALAKEMTAMVSRSFAEKIGGIQECIGKTIYNEEYPDYKFTVEGVFEDFPDNCTLSYDILLSMETYDKESTENWLGNDRYKGFVKLAEGVDPNTLRPAIRKMQENNQDMELIKSAGVEIEYFLKPFAKVHTSDPLIKNTITILSIVAVLLLVISLMNYVLIAISAVVKRSKEVGVRKCYGAETPDIYSMLSKEAARDMGLAVLFAVILVTCGKSLIMNILGVEFKTLLVPQSIIAIAVTIVILYVISVVAPARLYSRIPIAAAFRNYTESSKKWKLGLLGVQFFINMALVVMLVFVSLQYRKALYGEVGYDYENLLYLTLYNQKAQSSSERIKTELERLPEVEGVEFGYELPMSGSSGNNVYIPGMTEELFNFADQYSSTKGYNSLLGIPYVEGRAPEIEGEVAVDQNFAEKICKIGNWKDGAVGKTINLTGHGDGMSMYGDPFVICGVYRNYLLGTNAGRDYRPSARFYGDLSGDYWMKECLIRVNNADRQTIDKIQKIIDDIFPESTNKEVRSYAADLRGSYDDKLKMRNTIILGCILSLIVALIGLIGYIRDESNRRSKEMAIRKINGATTNEIIGLFIKDISRIAIISAILADVLAWYASRLWLQQFSEKISLSPWVFIAGNIVVLLIISGAVVLNCLRIAKANPVESLKNE